MARTFQLNLNDRLYRDEWIVSDRPFCMGAWFKNVTKTSQKTVLWYGSSSNADYSISLYQEKNTGYIKATDMAPASGTVTVTGSTSLDDGVWHHAIVNAYRELYSAPTYRYWLELFLDGSLIGSANLLGDDPSEDTVINANRYAIGRDMGPVGQFSFGGQLAEAIFGKRRVTANEAMALYRGVSPIRVLGTDLVRYHPLPGYLGGANYADEPVSPGNNWFGGAATLATTGTMTGAGANHPPVQPFTPFAAF